MQDQQAERLRALWKSGRDKYVSFFAVLNEVRAEIGDESLPKWCIEHLRIGISVISETKKVLMKVDADVAKRNLAASLAAEKAQARKAREDALLARELEKQERAKKIAEAKAEAERAKAQAERARSETKKAQDTEKRRRDRADPKKKSERQKRALTSRVSDAELVELVKRFKKADVMCQEGIERWIEGSIAKAAVLCAARDKFMSDTDFGGWLDHNGVACGHQDRAALIGLGRLGETRLREILTTTDSRSYRLIWEANKPTLKLVEN